VTALHLALLLLPLASCWLGRKLTRKRAVALTLGLLVGSLALGFSGSPQALLWGGLEILWLDELNRWLLAYACLIYLAIFMAAPRTQIGPLWSRNLMLSLTFDLWFFSQRQPLPLALLWVLSHAGLWAELQPRFRAGQLSRLRRILILFLGSSCLAFGLGALGLRGTTPGWALAALTLGIALRKAMVPFHSWLPELFEKGPLGHVIAFCAPQLGAYATVRLLADKASAELLAVLGAFALVTALHGACLAFGQNRFRGVYAGLFMGQTSLVFAGLQCANLPSLVGGLTVWLSGGLALTGLGLCVWALLARRGSMDLNRFHGGYERSPLLATSFLVFGLAACGFPGTLGFLGQDMLLQGTTQEYPHIGILTAVVTALNGITLMRTYFRLFCGCPRSEELSQSLRLRERLALTLLLLCLLGLGLAPLPLLTSRQQAGRELLRLRDPLPTGRLTGIIGPGDGFR